VRRIDVSNMRIPGTNLRGWRAIAVAALALYILLFVVVNNRKLEVNFVFFKIRSNELVALIVIVVLSFVAGFIVGGRRRKTHPGDTQSRAVGAGADDAVP
jgi:uncharacterized integral membrane protein